MDRYGLYRRVGEANSQISSLLWTHNIIDCSHQLSNAISSSYLYPLLAMRLKSTIIGSATNLKPSFLSSFNHTPGSQATATTRALRVAGPIRRGIERAEWIEYSREQHAIIIITTTVVNQQRLLNRLVHRIRIEGISIAGSSNWGGRSRSCSSSKIPTKSPSWKALVATHQNSSGLH